VSLVKITKLEKKNMFVSDSVAEPLDLILARDDGRIEIYSFILGNQFPTLCFEKQVKSTITSIDAGYITMANSKDILLSCYDGKILAVIDQKKFKKMGMMAREDEKAEKRNDDQSFQEESSKAEIKAGIKLDKEKKEKVTELVDDIAKLEK